MSVFLPRAATINTTVDGVTAFKGLDHRLKVNGDCFYDMRNMTGGELPVMSARKPRKKLRVLEKPNGLFAHDGKLVWVDGTDFYYDGILRGQVEDSPKRFVKMGAYVIIMPDKLIYNATEGTMSSMGEKWSQEENGGSVTVCLSRATGDPIEPKVQSEAPEDPANGDYWMDTGVEPNALRMYSGASSSWEAVPTVYTKIAAPGIGWNFEKDDGIEIAGCTDETLNGSHYIVERDVNWIVVVGLIREAFTQAAGLTAERKTPDMDFLCECNNRLWACSSERHEIYGSALGDPKNWYQYLGLGTDSYAATVGSSGDFTGIVSHMGDVVFHKESMLHRLSGTQPSNFTIGDTAARGTAPGAEGSLLVANETMLYMSNQDICELSSYLPSTISKWLGTQKLAGGTAGMCGEWYVISMRHEDGSWGLYDLNTRSGAWIREDDLHVTHFAALGTELYMLAEDGSIWAHEGTGEGESEGRVPWMLETGDMGMDAAYQKYISGIQLHAQCDLGTTVRVSVQYDGGNWKEIFRTAPVKLRSLVIPIVPRRCRVMRLRLEGEGGFRLYCLTRRMEAGSDVYL